MTANHRELAEAFLAMLNHHDPTAVDRFVAVDYVNHNRFVEDGREANREFWAAFFTAFPDLMATMDDLVMVDDRVVGRFTYRGTHRGPLFGIPPTGRPVEMHSIDIWRVAGCEFVQHWDELNMLEVFQQLGVIPSLGPSRQEQPS
ncbi:MAG TPA: ester cyclase [Streptosporangiaceae bacterium]|jgi:predicted ester cyclase